MAFTHHQSHNCCARRSGAEAAKAAKPSKQADDEEDEEEELRELQQLLADDSVRNVSFSHRVRSWGERSIVVRETRMESEH